MGDFAGAYQWMNIRFLLEGLQVTLILSAVSIVFSFLIGAVFGLLRYMKIPGLSVIVGLIIDIIRNLPLLLILFFTYFGLPNIGIRLNALPAAIVAMTIFESMMLAEIFRGGIQAVDPGQMEAARSNGLSYGQAMYHIILPQAIKKMIPAIVSQLISLVKDTSLATIIVLPELMYHGQVLYGQNSNYMIPVFVALTVMYFVVCYALSLLSKYLDHRLAA
ncbi:amino acid ABC transporter permease [Schleiferilactobacillus perolens]|jgi:putative glutamine transport system permease protein|uniref:Glutamine ABC transporter, permease protein n=1 Tax=Schleiferilactobacillus perolens DSM 12744 TaxID=1423792 RepID=A0A0R1N099_9LACO|nr:amino acid ABC transporter permease [Schleiferilactobacillus perolens]KRL10778.1 glutamine ABC transporter, permease protein [Schleiferilactobacillus perolens DSM 12744]MCI1892324.1 amino acid ABC transporter permease [Schleiferilactobacillus harbinensis]MCI1913751.1 amino acid ABC transporter permease [Schleiferilactobacillus harbinensis]MCI2171573.1 amino acid ABC transporter permease [Schleiferilactobacillus perolens]